LSDGKFLFQEGEGAGDVGRGHGGAAEGDVGRRGGDAEGEDGGAGGGEVDEAGAVGGVAGEFILTIGGGDGDDVVERVGGGVFGEGADFLAVVAGGGDEDDAGIAGAFDGVELGLGEGRGAVAGVDEVGAFGDGVVDAGDGGGGGAAEEAEEFQRHDFGFPRDAGDAFAVVADGADDAGDVGAVADGVEGLGGEVGGLGDGGVDAEGVVDVAVVIVVDAGAAVELGLVEPDVGEDVFVAVVEAGIEDGDDDVGGFALNLPRGGGTDVGAGGAAVGAGVGEGPLSGGEIGIVGEDEGAAEVVGLDVIVEAGGGEALDDGEDVFGAVGLQGADTAEARMGADEAEAEGGGGLGGRGGLGGEGGAGAGLGEEGAGAVAEADLFGGELDGGGGGLGAGEAGKREKGQGEEGAAAGGFHKGRRPVGRERTRKTSREEQGWGDR
jgi:hypothetical protein